MLITTREEYDYCTMRGFEPLVDDRFPMDIALRREVQKEKFGGNNARGNDRFYKFCLYHLPLVCKECGMPIRNPSAINVSHIISRGADARMAHDPRNVYILCARCHETYEHITTRRKMRIFESSEERKKLLRQEYNDRSKNW